ncbi:MAG: alpha/beta fold hydrolase [Granulosicoccus sp.]
MPLSIYLKAMVTGEWLAMTRSFSILLRRAFGIGAVAALLGSATLSIAADDEKPLDFSFTQKVPGEKVLIDDFRLHVSCIGSGETTVLFEAGLGGSSMEWIPVQQEVAEYARACIYDRAGYAWSDPSPNPSHVRSLSREADIMLARIGADGPLLLVGHSFGGFVVRELALLRKANMIGMVLVDASHENQLVRLEKIDGKNMMPRGNSFVVSSPMIPDSLPEALQRKIKAFSRMRKTYAALHSEMEFFRESANQVRSDRTVVSYPVTVVSRGLDLYALDKSGEQKTAIWDELQKDLVALSSQSKRIIATQSGHHVHTDNPELIVKAITEILDADRSQGSDGTQ